MADGVTQINKGDISAKFLSVGTGAPLADRDVIAIGPNYEKSAHHVDNRDAFRATSFRHILDGGTAALSSRATIFGLTYGQSIDFMSDDAYTRALDDVTETVQGRIDTDPDLQSLLAKESWSRDDRVDWERRTSRYVSEGVASIEGLSDYRHAPELGGTTSRFTDNIADVRALTVNDLAQDIENDSGSIEFDCETMSLTEGAVLQRIEDANLPVTASMDQSLKESASYFFTGGLLFNYSPNMQSTGHAFIVSSATGSVIESTIGQDQSFSIYQQAPDNYSFQDYASGVPVLGTNGAYVSYGEGGLTGTIMDFDRIDRDYFVKIATGDNDHTFQNHLDSAMEKSVALREHIGGMEHLPETQALIEVLGVQDRRSLSLMEVGDLNDLRYESAASDDFDELDTKVEDFTNTLMKLKYLAGDDPENLRQLQGFLKDQQADFGSLETQTPYAVHNDETNGIVAAYSAEDTISGELDASARDVGLKARLYERLDNQAAVQQPEQQNNSAGTLDIKF